MPKIVSTAQGVCRLCLETKDLKKSHFLPAAFYKSLHAADPDQNHPIVFTKSIAIHTSKQAQDYLLCGDCEDLFNRNGEDWVLSHCWQADGTFPLRTTLLGLSPAHSAPGFTIYETLGFLGVDAEKLNYFAASVFWRAAVKSWILVEPTKTLALGFREEELRMFLLKAAPFPKSLALMLSVTNDNAAGACEWALFPYLKKQHGEFSQYSVMMSGLIFDMFVGESLPEDYHQMSLLRSPKHIVFMSLLMDAGVVQAAGKVMSTATPKGKLAR